MKRIGDFILGFVVGGIVLTLICQYVMRQRDSDLNFASYMQGVQFAVDAYKNNRVFLGPLIVPTNITTLNMNNSIIFSDWDAVTVTNKVAVTNELFQVQP